MTIKETVLLCYAEDGELIILARPIDPLNPETTKEYIESKTALYCGIYTVYSAETVVKYNEDQNRRWYRSR